MESSRLADLIARHEAFLSRGPADRPLVGAWVGGYYPAHQYPRGVSSWGATASLGPERVSFGPFAEDYEELYRTHLACADDFVFVGSAYWGIPWLEAILGSPVRITSDTCRAEALGEDLIRVLGRVTGAESSPWLDALLRFTRDLVRFAGGRFPVCAPLLRGPGDAVAALLGGTAFVTGFLDEPEGMAELLSCCAHVRMEVLRRLGEVIPAWNGTYGAGGYPSRVWSGRTVAYYQEDCAALLSPTLFREFLLPPARAASAAAEVSFFHLHSACLYPVDILLEDGSFDVLEVNIDARGAGPGIPELVGTLERIQRAGRPLVLWGRCRPEEWDLVCRRLSPVGLSLQPMLDSPLERWRSP